MPIGRPNGAVFLFQKNSALRWRGERPAGDFVLRAAKVLINIEGFCATVLGPKGFFNEIEFFNPPVESDPVNPQ
jgi:hypothetical protein